MAAEPICYLRYTSTPFSDGKRCYIRPFPLASVPLEMIQRARLVKSKGDKLFIFVKGNDNRAICEGDTNENRERIIIGDITKDGSAELYLASIA